MQTPKSYRVVDPSGELGSDADDGRHTQFFAPSTVLNNASGEVWRSEGRASAPRCLETTMASGLHIACGAARAQSRASGGKRFSARGTTFALSYLDAPEVFETRVEPGEVRSVGIFLPEACIDDETARVVDSLRSQGLPLVQRNSPPLLETANRLLAPLPADYGEAAVRLVLEARGLELLAAAQSMFQERRERTTLSQRHRRIAQDATAYIDENLATKITISELGRAVASSPRTLTEAFRKTHGETIAAYVTRRRMEYAAALLRDGHSVSAAASAVAYSPNAFSNAFRHYAGKSPRDLLAP